MVRFERNARLQGQELFGANIDLKLKKGPTNHYAALFRTVLTQVGVSRYQWDVLMRHWLDSRLDVDATPHERTLARRRMNLKLRALSMSRQTFELALNWLTPSKYELLETPTRMTVVLHWADGSQSNHFIYLDPSSFQK